MKFSDTKGREWNIRVDFHSLCRIEDELGLPILENPTAMPNKIRAYVEMIWVLIEDQAIALGVTPEEFGRSLDGESIKVAVDVFIREYAVFLKAPSPAAGAAMEKMWELSQEAGQMVAQVLPSEIEKQYSRFLESQGLSLGDSHSGNS